LHLGLDPILEEENIKEMVGYGAFLFSINATPSDAIVKINGVERTSANIEPYTTVIWEVSRDGYVTQTGS
jgi:hypothetical protein